MSEQILQIIGAELIQNNLVEVTLIPFSNVKVKSPSILDLASGGIEQLIKETTKKQQSKTKLYITQDEWLNGFKNKLFSTIKLDMQLEKEMK